VSIKAQSHRIVFHKNEGYAVFVIANSSVNIIIYLAGTLGNEMNRN
jgi:hypothetical protein